MKLLTMRVNASMLIDFYKKMYSASNGLIVVAGKFDDSLYSQLEKEFGSIPVGENKRSSQKVITSKAEKVYEEKLGAIQSGIRIGKVLDLQYGSDEFFKLQILNTVFGGYFGSRLMSNIREDKGIYLWNWFCNCFNGRCNVLFSFNRSWSRRNQ